MAHLSLSILNPDLINKSNGKIWMGLIAALTHSSAKRAEAFYFGMVVPQNPPFPTTGGKDIKLLGMSVLFLERQNTALTLFFSACVPFFVAVRHLSHENKGKDEVENT